MAEWKLAGDEQRGRDRPWMDLAHQPGFAQRAAMVTGLVALVVQFTGALTVTDLGCGDGEMLAMLPPGLIAWGYEIGSGDVRAAQARGLDVWQADIIADPSLEYGRILIVSEVLEHLDDPAGFLDALPDDCILIASSPAAETGDWHNPVHSWAWDAAGYRALIESAGWRVLYQAECDGGLNTFDGVIGQQRFQAAVCAR
jgi:hypothetical protein